MPRIKNVDTVREWLTNEGRDACVAIASRSALRVLPLLKLPKDRLVLRQTDDWELLALSLFRTNFLVWSYNLLPERLDDLKANCTEARKQLLLNVHHARSGESEIAAFAASDAGLCATTDETENAIAAYHALQTVTSGSFGSNIRADAFAVDCNALRTGKSASDLIRGPLWLEKQSPGLVSSWRELEARLLALNQDWDVWTTWYADRVHGRAMSTDVLFAWASIEPELWAAGPAVVNAELRRLVGNPKVPSKSASLREPEPEPGPEFGITEKGLSLRPGHSPAGTFDQKTQQELHERLKRIAPLLAQTSAKNANLHPGLNAVASEYNELVAKPFNELDVTALWAVGAGLLANRDAFARAQDSRLMTEPLEPGHFALLQQAAEVHGGFILGFPQGRELAERADHARVSGEAMEKVVLLGQSIIRELLRSGKHIEDRTRKFLSAVEEGLVEPGWRITRAGYAAYVVTRNALIAIGRLLNWANSTFATVAGGVVLSNVDPGLVHTQFWIEFVIRNGQQILAFSEPFPELKIWLAAQIEAAEKDRASP